MSLDFKPVLKQLPHPALSAISCAAFAFTGAKLFTKLNPYEMAGMSAVSTITSLITQAVIDKMNQKMHLSEGKQQIVKTVVVLTESFIFLALSEALGFSLTLSGSLIIVGSLILGELAANFMIGGVLAARQYLKERKLKTA